jgi:hypothetical protein
VANESEPTSPPRSDTLVGIFRAAIGKMSSRERWGWAVSALGLLVMLVGVLHLTNATIGGPIHEFKDRRTYVEVKTAAHAAFPLTLLLGLGGLGIAVLGGRLRASSRRPAPDE